MSFTLADLTRLFGRRRDAEEALEHPAITAAFVAARERAIHDFTTSSPGATALREDAYHRLRALALVRQELEAAVAEHEYATAVMAKREAQTATKR